ncbi:MAG: hypothetical protein BroJett011_33700 [Chloroflexota bacterium]|nr:MAG: hypothetical protein BroJett011_33700 [Chloroflexota bacterium]
MAEPTTICFVGTDELKAMLEKWAKEDERSMSYVLRQILKNEVQRRMVQSERQKPVSQKVH